MFYHLGKISTIFGTAPIYALVDMWDDGKILMTATPEAEARGVKEGDIIIAMYEPVPGTQTTTISIARVIDGKAGERAWKEMREYHKKRTQRDGGNAPPQGMIR